MAAQSRLSKEKNIRPVRRFVMETVYCNSLDGGRIKLKRIVRDMMARKDSRNLVLEVDPGVGKTRTALHQAAKYGHQRKILYSAPTHELAEESYNRFCSLPGHPAAYYMYGRNMMRSWSVE